MNKKLVLGFLSLSINLAHANNSTSFITSATQAYSQNNLTALSTLAANNPDDNLATYLNANANLAKNNPAPSLDFIKNHQAGYLKNDLIHQCSELDSISSSLSTACQRPSFKQRNLWL
jgi:uncharacterized membrane protein YvbJ